MRDRVVLWDFDGTLARLEQGWTGALLRALDQLVPGHQVTREQLRPHLLDGFPWHHPERSHPHLKAPAAWWREVEGLLARAATAVGYGSLAAELACRAHRLVVEPASYTVYPDALPALERLGACGWRHVVLSNHVPELADIVRGLGLAGYFEAIHTSALLGYEKPHAQAFAVAVEEAGHPGHVWMIGDNPIADIGGALAAGIPAILVRREFPYPRYRPDLQGAVELILAGEG